MLAATNDAVAERARQWRLDDLRAVCDVLQPWEYGLFARSRRYPRYFVFNVVLVQQELPLGAEELIAIADEHLAGLEHRCVEFVSAEHGLALRAEFGRRGWRTALHLRMRHEGPRPRLDTDAHVEELPYEAAHELRLRWHQEDFPDVDARDHFADAAELSRLRDARVLAVTRGGRPVAFAQLERRGDGAEISDVYVHPDHRGQGIGTALTRAAILHAPDVRDLWIQADADDRPQHLYARLGFRTVTRELKFLRPRGGESV